MTRGKIIFLGMVLMFLLAACATKQQGLKSQATLGKTGGPAIGSKATEPEVAKPPGMIEDLLSAPNALDKNAWLGLKKVAPSQEQLPQTKAAPGKRHSPKAPLSSFKQKKKTAEGAISAKVTALKVAKPRVPMAAEPAPENGVMTRIMGAPAAADGEGEYTISMADRWNAFLQSFKDAVYTFNPPSPITVDKPRTVHLWVDTMIDQQTLAEELKRIAPWDAARIEAGPIRVSPEMRAILTGENFKINANSPEQQMINMEGRTIWSWEITPTWPGTQTLHLRLIAIPPDTMSSPYTIPVPLDRIIEVKVTFWWLIDHFFEKYWKWLLGGLGTLLMTFLGWWLKKRFDKEKTAT